MFLHTATQCLAIVIYLLSLPSYPHTHTLITQQWRGMTFHFVLPHALYCSFKCFLYFKVCVSFLCKKTVRCMKTLSLKWSTRGFYSISSIKMMHKLRAGFFKRGNKFSHFQMFPPLSKSVLDHLKTNMGVGACKSLQIRGRGTPVFPPRTEIALQPLLNHATV